MALMTLDIPDALAERLQTLADREHTTVEQVALHRLETLVAPRSPQAIVQAMRAMPQPDPAIVEELQTIIRAEREASAGFERSLDLPA